MVSRARVAALFVCLTITNLLVFAQSVQPNGALQGKVLNAEGRPVSGIRVELDDPSTAVPVTSTYTRQDGTFELYNVPKGNYEVIAQSADAEVSGPVAVQTDRLSMDLQFPRASSLGPLDATVSVARILVPRKAVKIYGEALDAFKEGKYDDAQRQIEAALLIEPQYADAVALRGLLELGSANLSDAQRSFEEAIRIDPSESAAYIALAAVYNHEGRFDDAMQASERGLSLAPRAWQAYLEMAKASISQKMYERGLKFLRQAERLGGNAVAEVHLVKACALLPLKLFNDAKYELQASLARERKGVVADQAHRMLAQLDTSEPSEPAPQP